MIRVLLLLDVLCISISFYFIQLYFVFIYQSESFAFWLLREFSQGGINTVYLISYLKYKYVLYDSEGLSLAYILICEVV
jgi:hypothetical protein